MIKPSFRLDDIKQYKIEGKIEPKVLAEYRTKPKQYNQSDITFFCLINNCPEYCKCGCVEWNPSPPCDPH